MVMVGNTRRIAGRGLVGGWSGAGMTPKVIMKVLHAV